MAGEPLTPYRGAEAQRCDGRHRPPARCAWCKYAGKVRFESHQYPGQNPRGTFPVCLQGASGRDPGTGSRTITVAYVFELRIGGYVTSRRRFTPGELAKVAEAIPPFAAWPPDKNPEGSCPDYEPTIITRLMPWRR